MSRFSTYKAVLTSALLSVLLLGAVACSDDGIDTSSDTTAAPKPSTTVPAEEPEEEEVEVFDPDAGSMEAEDEQAEAAGEFMGQVEEQTQELPDDTDSYSGYTGVSDNTGALYVEVPVEFVDVLGGPNTEGQAQIDASTDVDGYIETWDVPGLTYVNFGSETTGFSSSQEAFESTGGSGGVYQENCTFDSSETYAEANVEYTVGYYLDCAGTDTDYGVVYIFLGTDQPILSIAYQLTSQADGEAFQQALATFDFDPSLL